LGHWPLDSNTYGIEDVEGRFQTSSSGLVAAIGPCDLPGTSYTFNKAQKSHVKVEANNKLKFAVDFTIIMFVNPSEGNAPLIEYGTNGLKLGLSSDFSPSFELAYSAPSGESKKLLLTSSLNLTRGKWSFLAVTYSFAQGILKFFKDASIEQFPYVGKISGFVTSDDVIFGGRFKGSGVDPDFGYSGGMSDVMMFDKAVSHVRMRKLRSSCPRCK
jgi:hypothetical protein